MTASAAPVPSGGRDVWRAGAWLLAVLGILLSWELAARWNAGSFVIAGPGDTLAYLRDNAALLARALGATLTNAAWGFVYGNFVAVVLAAGVVLAPRAERLVNALALLVFCLPLVATGPILRVLFGTGSGPQVTLAALAVYYTTFLPLVVGLRAVPRSWLDLVRSHGRRAGAQMIYVRAAASVPYLIAGLQIAVPAAVLGAMIGEFTGAERGLGVLTIRAMRALDVDATWGIAALAAGVSILGYAAFGWLGRLLLRHRPELLLSAPAEAAVRSPVQRLASGALIVIAVLALWQGTMVLFNLHPFFAKRPGDVAAFLLTAPDAAQHRAVLLGAYGETLILTLPGYIAGLALGAGLACAVLLAPGAARIALPLSIALRSVPIVTTAPLIVLALGRGAAGTITIVTVMIFFPTLVACLKGLHQTPGQVTDIFASYAAGRWRLLRLARIPAMLPAFFAAARMAIPAAILAVTTAEWLATGNGIGSLMALTASTSDYNMLWSAVALIGVTASLAHLAVGGIERSVLRIYAPEQMSR